MTQTTGSPARPNLTSIAAACILSGGLITAAIIDSHKPAAIPVVSTVSANGTAGEITYPATRPAPPFSKEAVSAQITAQLMAAAQPHGMLDGVKAEGYSSVLKDGEGNLYQGVYRLTGVTVKPIEYDAKEDKFSVGLSMDWQSVQPSARPAKIQTGDGVLLHNDGYGQYAGSFYMPDTKNVATKTRPEFGVSVR